MCFIYELFMKCLVSDELLSVTIPLKISNKERFGVSKI